MNPRVQGSIPGAAVGEAEGPSGGPQEALVADAWGERQVAAVGPRGRRPTPRIASGSKPPIRDRMRGTLGVLIFEGPPCPSIPVRTPDIRKRMGGTRSRCGREGINRGDINFLDTFDAIVFSVFPNPWIAYRWASGQFNQSPKRCLSMRVACIKGLLVGGGG